MNLTFAHISYFLCSRKIQTERQPVHQAVLQDLDLRSGGAEHHGLEDRTERRYPYGQRYCNCEQSEFGRHQVD